MKVKTRTRNVLMSSDYSAQEPRILSQLCQDEGMLDAYRSGKDLYSQIAAIAFHRRYEDCLEHFPEGTPIRQDGKYWVPCKEGEPFEKLANGTTDTYHDGKEYRSQAKKILLGIMYGRGENSIAEQLGCPVQEAKQIKDNVYTAFPAIKKFEQASLEMATTKGYVTTLWGRKRRLPVLKQPLYRVTWTPDELKLRHNNGIMDDTVPESLYAPYIAKLEKMENDARRMNRFVPFSHKQAIYRQAEEKDHIIIYNTEKEKADATRQVINSRVQGCLDGSTKIITEEYGVTNIASCVNETLKIWDGEDWTSGTVLASGKKQKCIIYLANGETIICSPDHRFRVTLPNSEKKWKKCIELTENDDIDEASFPCNS